MHNLIKFKQHGVYQCLMASSGHSIMPLGFGFKWQQSHLFCQHLVWVLNAIWGSCLLGHLPLGERNWGTWNKLCEMTYLWSFVLSCLCCRSIYRGVAFLVSIIKYALGNSIWKSSIWKSTHCTREKKARGKKKVQKDRNLSENISVMEIKMHWHYLGTGSLKFQFNF